MQCMQRTVTNGIGPRTSDAVGKEGEEVKLFITLHQTDFLFMGTQEHWKWRHIDGQLVDVLRALAAVHNSVPLNRI